jgi:hypothetical protein
MTSAEPRSDALSIPLLDPLRKIPLRGILLSLLAVLVIFAVTIPNLLRSRKAADEASRAYRQRLVDSTPAAATTEEQRSPSERKVKRTLALEIVSSNPVAAAREVTAITIRHGGFVHSLDYSQSVVSNQWSLSLRIPDKDLDAATDEIKALASKVERENMQAQDVTAEFVDLEPRLRNAQREEDQYAQIMKRSGTIEDTVAVAEKLTDVRERIERMQGQLGLMNRQVEMASVALTLRRPPDPVVAKVYWTPGAKLKAAWIENAQGFADYFDSMAAFLLRLPLLLVWFFTVLAFLVYGLRMSRWLWSRWIVRALRISPDVTPR